MVFPKKIVFTNVNSKNLSLESHQATFEITYGVKKIQGVRFFIKIFVPF